MNLLIFSPIPTYPQNSGNKARIYNTVSHLRNDFKIHFVYFNLGEMNNIIYQNMLKESDSFTFIKVNKKLKKDTSSYFKVDDWYQNNIGEIVAKICKDLDIDIILVNYIFQSKLLEYIPDTILKIIDTHDKFTDRHLLLQKNGVNKSGWWFYTTKQEEAKGLNRADIILAIQEDEAEFFKSITKVDVRVLKHIENEKFIDKKYYKLQKIGFVGSQNSVNNKSIENFLKVFVEFIKTTTMDIHFYLAGQISQKVNIEHKNIKKLGFVENLKDFYEDMDLIINPLTFGTGLKIKTVEALSFGVPIISTKVGFEGIKSNSKYHQADSLNDLISLIIDIEKEPNILNELSIFSRDIFLEYDKNVQSSIKDIFSEENLKKEKKESVDFLKEKIKQKDETILKLYGELQELKFEFQKKKPINNKQLNRFSQLTNSIETICKISTIKNPIKKLKAYKNMLKIYHVVK